MNSKLLTGCRCQCSGCDEHFNSLAAFDKHRTGAFGKDRRCMTPEQMQAKGMSVTLRGWWITKGSSA
jgi:hypothetical protein